MKSPKCFQSASRMSGEVVQSEIRVYTPCPSFGTVVESWAPFLSIYHPVLSFQLLLVSLLFGSVLSLIGCPFPFVCRLSSC
uniref:Uncharacterized protein n=1 Tax=Utricularia reniformis TaxID=192314 RepID=A0A1Y0B269_9LAMI|nr:hypothetical protein AEK19_MT1276 [Utricularia reniformis]ART31481.1 hypothetical protein AEK19_MT1276 [Utricularia reniformis]